MKKNQQGQSYQVFLSGQKGVVALIIVLVISGLALAIILTASFLDRGGLIASSQNTQASQSHYLTEACAQIALIKLKDDIDYIGDETLDIQGAACQIRPISGTGNENRIIQTRATYKNQVRKLQIEVSVVNPETQITSWQELADF